MVELFQSGDSRAFEDLYARYFQRIYRFCLKRVGDPHEAEELAQEAFTRAYCAMPRFDGDRRFYPWLTVIASRLCVDTHRRRGRTSPTEHVELGVVDGGQEAILEDADRELLAKALERVNPRHREVLRLREAEGLSYEQIAGQLGVRVGTIEALLFRARRALRREFHALAGTDGRLAGLPVVGWVIRRMLDTRGRFAELAGQAAPLMAAGAMSVAIVAAGGSVGGTPHGAIPATRAAAPVPTIQMPAMTVSSVAGSAAPRPVAPAAATAPNAPQPAARQPVEVTPGPAAAERAHQMPIHARVGEFEVGIDPHGIQTDGSGPVLP